MYNAKVKKNLQKIRLRGVTVIEIILVIAIVAILAASISPFLSNFILRNNLETAQNNLVSAIRKAQEYSIDAKDNSLWGVCEVSGNVRLFRGTCTSPTFSQDYDISSTVTMVGLNEVTFSKLRGEPSLAFNVTLSTDIDSVTVNLNSVGGLDIER